MRGGVSLTLIKYLYNESRFTYTVDDDCEYDAFLFFIISYPSTSGTTTSSQRILITKDELMTISDEFNSGKSLDIDGTVFRLTFSYNGSPQIILVSPSSKYQFRWLYGIKF